MSEVAVGRAEIAAASERLRGHVRVTPVVEVRGPDLDVDHDAPLVLKLELLQLSGSFKARGATNLLRATEVPEAGVVGASGGNFGLALALAADRLGIAATVFVPDSSSSAKVDRLRTLGARVEVVPGFYAEALEASVARAAETGALFAHAYDQREVVAGQGTVAVELDGQASTLDTVLVAVGGGGLIGGVASWYRGATRVVGVETRGCPSMHMARKAGRPVDVVVSGLAADSLGARRVGELGFAAQSWVEDVLLVDDAEVVEAQRRLWRQLRVAAEPGGAAAMAALTSGAYRPVSGERVGVLICGGNVDPGALPT